mgnify:CR=1 FL=1
MRGLALQAFRRRMLPAQDLRAQRRHRMPRGLGRAAADPTDPADVQEVFVLFDADQDGKLDLKEFCVFVREREQREGAGHARPREWRVRPAAGFVSVPGLDSWP